MSNGSNLQIRLAGRPEPTEMVREDHFEAVEAPVPEPGQGEVLVRILYASVNSYMSGRIRARSEEQDVGGPGTVQIGDVIGARGVGEVAASNHPDFAQGDVVKGRHDEEFQWAEYVVASGSSLTKIDPAIERISYGLSLLGSAGHTAYFGMLDVARPRPGDTAVVSAAAGSVGSVAVQIARMAGARVVGTAGSDRKIEYLRSDLGAADGINYRQRDDLNRALGETCPDGIDVYFDNVGTDITDAVMEHLNVRGRVAVCGQISRYNDKEGTATGPRHFWKILRKRARVEGFIRDDFTERYDEATAWLTERVLEGELTIEETVTEGLENAPSALVGLFEGKNVGKQLVKVAEPRGEFDHSG